MCTLCRLAVGHAGLFFPRHGIGLFRPRRLGIQVLRGVLLFASSALYFQGLAELALLPTAATVTMTGLLLITALSVPFWGSGSGLGIGRRLRLALSAR